MSRLGDKYSVSVNEWALKFYIFFIDAFSELYDYSQDEIFAVYPSKSMHILSESIVYSFMLHEVLSFKKIQKVRKEVMDIICGNASIRLIESITNKRPSNNSDFADFVWKRYEEYSNIYMNKNACNLLYYPVGFPKEMYDDGFSCLLLRYHGIIIETMFGHHDSIPGVEKGPLVIRDNEFDLQYSQVFKSFFKTVLDEAIRDIRLYF